MADASVTCDQCKKSYRKLNPTFTVGSTYNLCADCKLDIRLTNMEQQVVKMKEQVRTIQSQSMTEYMSFEICQRIRRRKNVLVRNLTESRKSTKEGRLKDDKRRINRAISSFCRINLSHIWIKRLPTAVRGGPRPVRACLKRESDVRLVLSKKHLCNLNLRFTRDITSRQRSLFFDALNTLKSLRQRDITNKMIKYIKGVPHIIDTADPRHDNQERQIILIEGETDSSTESETSEEE